jgi:hypothetical protein
MIVRASARTALTAAVLIVCVTALLTSASALAAGPVRPSLGRWEGHAGSATIVFTVEETHAGTRYLVRPVVYCAYTPPKPSVGSVTLINPKHGPGGGGETGPEGAECTDAATLSPRFAPEETREILLGSFSAGPLPLEVSGSLSLGSVGVCQRA